MQAMLIAPALAAFAVSFVCVLILLSKPVRGFVLDRPNERSLHERPIPRSGGLAILAGVAAGSLFAPPGLLVPLVAGAALAVVAFADDVSDVPTVARLIFHLVAAAAVLGLEQAAASPVAFVLFALALAWSANLYNFMDGADGLAGGMAVFGFGTYAIAAQLSGHAPLATVSAVVAAASAAFLVFNFPPARIFMGDVGAVPLGFLAGALGVLGWHDRVWPLWFPMLVFAPFACDATLTLLKRLARGEKVWQAHRDHYYQRLVRMGFGHRGAAFIEYSLMAACAATALAIREESATVKLGTLLTATVVLLAIAGWIDVRWAKSAPPEKGRKASYRGFFVYLHDVAAAGAAWLAAFWLRFNLDMPDDYLDAALATLPWVMLAHALVFWRLGLYHGLWRFASLPDLRRILAAVAFSALLVTTALIVALFYFQWPETAVPRSAFLVAPMLLVGAMSGNRLLYRAWKEGRLIGVVRNPGAEPVIVLGAGTSAAALLRDLAGSASWRVVALLDDDETKQGGTIHDVKVLGPLQQAGRVARRMGAQQAIIAMPNSTHAARKRALDLCNAAGLRVMTVPAYADIVSGKLKVSQLRQVELDDLLGRDPVQLDVAQLGGFLGGKTVLVTGAGGSIGAELCRQIARFAPARIVLFDLSEFALYTIEQEFRDRYPEVPVIAAIGDAKDERRVRELLRQYAPQIVFHAAAYKHVPLMEDENALQAVANNALSALVTARAAQAAGAEKYVLVSTDKAVNPTNVMGASKRLAELICQAVQGPRGTQFVLVRFGNVLGSTGSVIPRFREQVARGGPVTVTHPEIQRYFMSIPEAAQLVLQAALMGKGGEIYVLDMGEPVKIAELARELIRLSGLTEQDVPIVYTGLRPGEKLYEELLADAETTLPTPHPKLRIAKARAAQNGALVEEITAWIAVPGERSAAQVRAQLKAWIPEYTPAENAK